MTWIRRWSVCVLALAVFGPWPARGQMETPGPRSEENAWLARFNAERVRAGAPLLRPAPVLDQVAREQAEEMARGGWRLRPPTAAEVGERLRRAGYSAHDWREDYLISQAVSEDVVAAREAGSRTALDSRFRDLGVGRAETAGGTLYVFVFGWHEGDFFAGATARLADRERVEAEMLARVNDIRRRAGLPPLARSPLLDRISQEHADDMLLRGYSGHRTPEGLGPSDRARADGYAAGIGENIVAQRYSVDEALEAWLGSPGHRRNLLDPGCRELGLGLALGGGYDAAPGRYGVVWVQSFGRGE